MYSFPKQEQEKIEREKYSCLLQKFYIAENRTGSGGTVSLRKFIIRIRMFGISYKRYDKGILRKLFICMTAFVSSKVSI